MIFADVMTWGQVGAIAGVVSGVVITTIAIATYFSRTRVEVSPQPFEVKAAEQFARKHELDRIERDVITLSKDRKRDAGELHEKINSVDRKVAGLEKATELQNQRLLGMDQKLDRLIER